MQNALTFDSKPLKVLAMTIRITAAQEEKLEYFAALEGITVDELAEKVLTEFLDEEERVRAALQKS